MVISGLQTLQGMPISFLVKSLNITYMDLPELGPYNFPDLMSYDCSLAHSALATQTSDLEIGLPSAWKTPPQVATSIFNATFSVWLSWCPI